jgi:GT2 family glycosyltransferase
MDLSIIFVSYNGRDVLDVALEAVYASKTNYSYEVIIVDNKSPDDSNKMIREKYLRRPDIAAKTRLIENDNNDGFAIGNNIGMKLAKGDYLLLLNTDTKVAPENFQVMLDFMKSRGDVGISSCKLLKANGEIDWSSRRTEPDPKVAFMRLSGLQLLFPKKFGAYNFLNKHVDEETEVDAVVGAYMFMSRACYEATQGFDESFFMYGEDLDLCKRARDAGFKIWYYPKTICMHFRGQSSKKEPLKNLFAFHNAMWLYYKKHYQKKYNIFMDAFVYTGVWGRYFVKRVQNAFRKNKFISK